MLCKQMSVRSFAALLYLLSAVIVFFFCLSVPRHGSCNELSVLSLDELLDLDAISVAKVPEKVTKTPAAIYIITGEDLRRNNVQTIPEALRMVPGLHVYRIDSNKWAVSARGFASRFANKMLVMIDGRTVYSTLFSGVYWDVQDVMIEDIDRIEVIRGPGGTLWGANAVNGVINIISKDSADTQGGLVSAQAGTDDNGELSARYGGWLNDRTSYRLYGKYFTRGSFELPSGADAADGWHQGRGGFRMDMNFTAANKLTLQGDMYKGESGETVKYVSPYPPYINHGTTDAPVSGGNILGRWTRTFSKASEIVFQGYYDHLERNEYFIDETLDTVDFDFQHRLGLDVGLEILWGLGYRYSRGDTEGKETIPGVYSYRLEPRIREDNLLSGFLQGRLPVASDRGEIIVGTKVEHNDYTGFEWQPSARVMWNIDAEQSVWAAVSRSVRTPSRLEHDAVINAGMFSPGTSPDTMLTFIRLLGNPEVESETVYSYETGYRTRVSENVFVDLSTYYNNYRNLVAGIPLPAFPEISENSTRLILPVLVDNALDGETYGAELSCRWSVTDWWRLTGGLTWFHFNALSTGNSLEARQGFEEDENAGYLVSLLSYMDLTETVELNASLYGVDALGGFSVDSYVRLDLNVVWHPTEHLSIAAGGRNLFHAEYLEFSNTMDGVLASEVPQILYTRLTVTF